jgi:aspartate carbamoyltransferase catalytic subunit
MSATKAGLDLGKDLIGLEDLSREQILGILDTAEPFKEISERQIKKVPVLRGQTIVNLFFEPSTRTRISFEFAEKRLGADTVNISSSGSSNVINAGDGQHEHPTQGLLDLLTIRDRFGSIDGRRVCIVGDILHSRVARSNIWGLLKCGAEVAVCGPKTLIPKGIEELGVHVIPRVEEAIEWCDVLYVLRLQLERMDAGYVPSLREYNRVFGISSERLERASDQMIVLHPGPMNRGVEIDSDVADGPRSVILPQVTNGVAVRMAVLYLLSGGRPERAEAAKRGDA